MQLDNIFIRETGKETVGLLLKWGTGSIACKVQEGIFIFS